MDMPPLLCCNTYFNYISYTVLSSIFSLQHCHDVVQYIDVHKWMCIPI